MDFKEFSVLVLCGPRNNPFGLGLDSEERLFELFFCIIQCGLAPHSLFV